MNEWDRRTGEPVRWYSRFESFRLIGPGRSVDAAYRLETGRDTSQRAGAVWWKNYRAREWQSRAEAWDMAERDRLRVADEERRRVAREVRIELLQNARDGAWKAVRNANLAELDEETARQMLGSLRMLLFDALKGERLEMGEPTEIVGDVDLVRFKADELAKAEEDVQEWRERRRKESG